MAEHRLRGVVHFHALIRLDGARTADGFTPAPPAIDAGHLADLICHAVASVRLTWRFVGPVGIEPTTRGLKVRCSAN